jgi:protein involved in polysaccharide export with SLBB domain
LKPFLLLLTLLFCTATLPLAAQVPVPQEAQLRAYLGNRDIDETELRQRLAACGIQVDNLTPEQALRLRPQVEAVIAEMEAEKAQATKSAEQAAAKATEKKQEAQEGALPVAQAITIDTTETANEVLPESDIYGHQVFRNKSLKVYRTTDNATPPDSYPLKPGDEIAVTIFGASQSDFILRLDDQGFVQLDNGLRMPLGGIPIGEARTLLANRLRQFYTFRNGQLSIRIQAARTISVNIFGEVENNGSFSMSSLNTGFNALVAAGGPTDRGTVRNIQLIQGDKKVILDVYDYLRSPTEGTALFLNNNATIFVPLAKTIVTLEGGVQRPLRYELKAGETLADLLTFAGGLKPRAEAGDIRITRYVRGQLELLNVNFTETPNFVLLDEDIVNVPIIENPIENFVTIEGAVLLPGRYPFGQGVTLGELLAQGRLRPGARTDVAFLFRSNDDGTNRLIRLDVGAAVVTERSRNAGAEKVELQRGDRLQVLASSAFTDAATFTVSGAIRDSSVTLPFPQDGALTVAEAVLLAGGTEANAEPEVMLIRTPLTNREERKYERLDLRTDGDFVLQALDRIIVYARERFSDLATVSISGAVRNGGTYTYDPSLTIRDLLYLAGGTRIDAAPDRVEVFRLQITAGVETKTLLTTIDLNAGVPFELQAYDEVVVRSAAEFEAIQNVVIQGEVRYPGRYALLKNNERLSDLIERAGGVTSAAAAAAATLYRGEKGIGYVVLDLDKVLEDPADPANMVILGGDTLYVPKRNELVTIYTTGTLADRFGRDSTTIDGTLQVAYQGDRRADWYVDNYAGGFAENARQRWTTVEYASGRVKETEHFLLTERFPRLAPGASIRVGLKPVKPQREERKEPIDWGGIAQATLAGVTSFVTIFLLLDRN